MVFCFTQRQIAIGFSSIRASDSRCRRRKRNYAMSIKRLLDAVERRGDIGRRVAALVLPISNRLRVTSSCAGKIGLCQPGEHTSGPNLASRDNVAHNQNLYTILETPPPVISLCRKQARICAIRWSMLVGVPRVLARSCRRRTSTSPAVKSNQCPSPTAALFAASRGCPATALVALFGRCVHISQNVAGD